MAYNEQLAIRMRVELKQFRGMQDKKLFGGIGFLIGGNMACGVHNRDLIARLSEDDFRTAIKSTKVRIFDLAGRPMNRWILVSPDGYASDTSLRSWIKKSITFAKSLPRKKIS